MLSVEELLDKLDDMERFYSEPDQYDRNVLNLCECVREVLEDLTTNNK